MSSKIKTKDHLETLHEYGILIPNRTIFLDTSTEESGEADGVNYFMAMRFLKNFRYLESLSNEPITIIMNTHGGSCVEGFVIYDAIKQSKCHIIIKVIGCAMSMGCVILQAADERVLSPWSSIMFHAGSGGVGAYSPAEAYNSVEFDKRFMDRMYMIILDKINEKREKMNMAHMAKKTFELENLKGKYMFAEEAVELGIADRIES